MTTATFPSTLDFLGRLLNLRGSKAKADEVEPGVAHQALSERVQGAPVEQPSFTTVDAEPVNLTEVDHGDGRMSRYPPPEKWDDWVEWDAQAWPRKVGRRYTLVPTICFNCESACGLLAYVDKSNYEIRRFEGNPAHPGSRGRNCAKGPATHNQIYDPERILYPLKRIDKHNKNK